MFHTISAFVKGGESVEGCSCAEICEVWNRIETGI